MEGVLALLIPVLALATGFVAVLKKPRAGFAPPRDHDAAPETAALAAEVADLRDELARMKERLDFTERLLMDAQPAPRLAGAEPAQAAATAAHASV